MSRVMIESTYDITPYLLGRPRIKVVSSTINGSLFLQESSVSLRYVKGMFDGTDPVFYVGMSVVIYDDKDVVIYDGYLRSIDVSSGATTLTLISKLGKLLGGVINWQQGPEHPAIILQNLLDASGIPSQGVTSLLNAYPEMLALSTARASDNIKGYDYISMIADMMTLDIVIENGVVVCVPPQVLPVGEDGDRLTEFPIGSIGGGRYHGRPEAAPRTMAYPTLIDSGATRLIKGVSIKYTFDGEVPLSFGAQSEYCWSATYDSTSTIQCYGEASANELAKARMRRYGKVRPIYQMKVRATEFDPYLGAWYSVNEGPMTGNFRLVGYEYDGEIYYPMLEAE